MGVLEQHGQLRVVSRSISLTGPLKLAHPDFSRLALASVEALKAEPFAFVEELE